MSIQDIIVDTQASFFYACFYGQNRFIDNWAGNRDGMLHGSIRSDFERYIDPSGQMTLLLYAERQLDRTFHDYMAVTVLEVQPPDD
jgi:hypothetical protein